MAQRHVNKRHHVTKSSKIQSSVEYLSVSVLAILIVVIVIAVIGFLILSGRGPSTYSPSVCIISSQLSCVQATIANTAGNAIAMVVFTNNLGIPITFGSSAITVYPNEGQQGYQGSCFPTNVPVGGAILCSANLGSLNPQVGSQLQPKFQIAYSQCTGGQCSITNITGTSTVSVTNTIPTAQVQLVTFPSGVGSISVNGNDYPPGTLLGWLAGRSYNIFPDTPNGGTFRGWLSTGGVSVTDALAAETTAEAGFAGMLEASFECFGLTLLANPTYAGTEAASPPSDGLCPNGQFLPTTGTLIEGTPSSVWWAFSSWTGSAGGYTGTSNPGTISDMTQNITDTANYERCYALTFYTNPPNGGSEVAGAADTGGCTIGYYLTGTSTSITATPASPYWIFDGWTGSGTTSYTGLTNPSGVSFQSNITETAKYLPCYSLTLYASPSGAGTESPNVPSTGGCPNGYYESGTSVTITATRAPVTSAGYYTFSSWSGTVSSSSNPLTVEITAPTTETANYYYTNCYPLTLSASGSGSPSASPSSSGLCFSGEYTPGYAVSVSSNPSYGWVLESWSNGDRTDPASVTINSATSLTATYLPCYSISLSTNGGGSASDSQGYGPSVIGSCPGGTYPQGTQFSLSYSTSTSPAPGWQFSTWSGSGSGSYSGGGSGPATLDSDISEEAIFNPCWSINYGGAAGTPVTVYGSPGAGCYSQGTPISIDAYADNNNPTEYGFGDWTCSGTGCASGSTASQSFSLESPTQEVAHFNPCVYVFACTPGMEYHYTAPNGTVYTIQCEDPGSPTDGTYQTNACFTSGSWISLRADGDGAGSGIFSGWAVENGNGAVNGVPCAQTVDDAFQLTSYTQVRAYWCYPGDTKVCPRKTSCG